jgi:hypothetical protein
MTLDEMIHDLILRSRNVISDVTTPESMQRMSNPAPIQEDGGLELLRPATTRSKKLRTAP